MNVIILCGLVMAFILLSSGHNDELSLRELNRCDHLFHGKCYSVFYEQPVSYASAKETCQKHNGKLASIPDASTQRFINSGLHNKLDIYYHCRRLFIKLDNCRIWIDLFTKTKNSKDFFTSDGTLAKFFDWASDQPDLISKNGNSNDLNYCGSMNILEGGDWYDDSCLLDRNVFLCERKREIPELDTQCNVNDIVIPNANFDSCHENKFVSRDTLIRIRCNDGYVMDGVGSVVCRNDGTWITSSSCRKTCLPPVPLPHTSIFKLSHPTINQSAPIVDVNMKQINISSISINAEEVNYIVNQSNFILCDPGYVMETDTARNHFVITCSENGIWENLCKCVPVKRFQVITVGASLGEEIKLDCLIPNETYNDWLWQKHSLAVRAEDGYHTSSNGTLHIANFQVSHEGIYTCIALSPVFTVGRVSYDLKLQPTLETCLTTSDMSVIRNVVEGTSIVINCPYSGTDSTTKSITWLKDGQPLIETGRLFDVPDGSLVISRVVFSDKGQYSCNVSWNFGLCSSRVFTDLAVDALAESVCGNSEMMISSPWTVSLYLEDEHSPFCYGALIHNQWIVTSAHCMLPFSRKRSLKLFVLFGQELLVDMSDNVDMLDSKSNKIRHVESIKIHPKYSQRLFANDVALVKLRERITFSGDVQPICLTDKNLTESKPCASNTVIHGVTSGWGQLDEYDPTETKFLTENMSVMNVNLCNVTAAASAVKHTDAICATPTTSEAPNYAGNVGSPLVVEYENRVYLLGIFMLGERYTLSGNNDYFTNIPNYYSWIKTILV